MAASLTLRYGVPTFFGLWGEAMAIKILINYQRDDTRAAAQALGFLLVE
jgi:hypothetical protein